MESPKTGVPVGGQLSSKWLLRVLIFYELRLHPVWNVASKVHICLEDNAWEGFMSFMSLAGAALFMLTFHWLKFSHLATPNG